MKKCKVCRKEFKPTYSSVQMVCSPKCAIEYTKQKKKNKQVLDKAKKERNDEKRLKTALKTTELAVHKYIRERDKGKPCISCGKAWQPTFQAGHLFSRKQYGGLKYHLDNIHGQCEYCNLRLEGNVTEYTLRLPERIGSDRFDKLIKLARLEKKYVKKWTLYELEEIRKNLPKVL